MKQLIIAVMLGYAVGLGGAANYTITDPLSQIDFEHVCFSWDLDGSGTVDFSEFKSAWERTAGDDESVKRKSLSETDRQLLLEFELIDKNENGELDASDFDHMFRAFDIDGNKLVTFYEFCTGWTHLGDD